MTQQDQYHEWLAVNAQGSGLLGCAVGFPSKTWICVSLSEALEVPAMDAAMRCISDTFDVAALHHIPSLEQHWAFDKIALFCARRPDKLFLALFADIQAIDLDRARQVIEDFKIYQPLNSPAAPPNP